MSFTLPFSGLKVIELANVLAGPSVGMFFAELGAEVIKVENPEGGDITRKWKLPAEDPASATSAYFVAANWGKQHLFADLSSDDGQRKIHELLAAADLLIVNFKPRDAEKFGLSYEALAERYPRLIYGKITGYGEQDPRTAFDLALQAETGYMSMNGTAESGPVKMPVAMIDLLAAHQLKEGLLTALLLREKNGKGCCVHVSLYDAAIASLANQATNYLVAGQVPGLSGSLHPNIAPYGETFACKDGRLFVVAIGTDAQFSRFCRLSGLDILAYDPAFAKNPARVRNRENLAERMRPFFLEHDSVLIARQFAETGIPGAIVRTVAEALDSREAEALVLNSSAGKCVRTAIFSLSGTETSLTRN
jgi:crotonobetainyl-CoA:carnitine CoA-transferase CaiB-like acyl-CoA transferase